MSGSRGMGGGVICGPRGVGGVLRVVLGRWHGPYEWSRGGGVVLVSGSRGEVGVL